MLSPLFLAVLLVADPLPPLLHGSSVAAVLAQRGSLQLTPEQVKQLEQVESRLVREQQVAREELSHPPHAPPVPGAPPPGKSAGGGPGGGMGGAKSRPPPNVRSSAPSPAQVLEQRLDELDTQAFLKSVEMLPEPQREKAIEIASRYREQLFEQREREKNR
jgi:hypothetical protein